MNVEAIASKSAPFKIYVFGNSASMHSINLPVHFRYHLAGDDRYRHRSTKVCVCDLV